jgi:ABC-type dipeptide/oligopeptide/nickel transport system permease component
VSARSRHYLFVAIGRALLLTVLITLLAFAVSLFLAIVVIVLVAIFKGGAVDMAFAYRHIALPFALIVLCVTLLYMLLHEIRDARRCIAAERSAPLRAA